MACEFTSKECVRGRDRDIGKKRERPKVGNDDSNISRNNNNNEYHLKITDTMHIVSAVAHTVNGKVNDTKMVSINVCTRVHTYY